MCYCPINCCYLSCIIDILSPDWSLFYHIMAKSDHLIILFNDCYHSGNGNTLITSVLLDLIKSQKKSEKEIYKRWI